MCGGWDFLVTDEELIETLKRLGDEAEELLKEMSCKSDEIDDAVLDYFKSFEEV